MAALSYNDYIEKVPEETRKFIKSFLNQIISNGCPKDIEYLKKDQASLIFYYALVAYKKLSEENAAFMVELGFNANYNVLAEELPNSVEKRKNKLVELYRCFAPNYIENLAVFTPERIILNFYKALREKQKLETFRLIDTPEEEFITAIAKKEEAKTKKLIIEMKREFFNDLPISSINYYNTVGQIFRILRSHKHLKDDIQLLQYLSMIIGVYYYNHISTHGEIYNEKERIIAELAKKGITKKKIEEAYGISIDQNLLRDYDPTLVLREYFGAINTYLKKEQKQYVSEIYHKLCSGIDGNKTTIKEIFGNLGLTINSVSDSLEKVVNETQEYNNCGTLDELYKNLSDEVKGFMQWISKYFNFVNKHKDELNTMYITTKEDVMALSILLLSLIELRNELNVFMEDNNVTLERVLRLVGLPEVEEFKKQLAYTSVEERPLVYFKNTFFKNEISKKDDIMQNFMMQKETKSTAVSRIFKELSGNELEDNYGNQVKDYLDKKTQAIREQRKKEVLSPLTPDVRNFLAVVCDYYKFMEQFSKDPETIGPLAIILGASRHNNEYEIFLNSLGLTREKILNIANPQSCPAEKREIDFDLVDNGLRKFIFTEEDPRNITPYTILKNAFDPNKVDRLLYAHKIYELTGKELNDLQDLDRQMRLYKLEKLLKNVTGEVKNTLETAVRIQKRIKEVGYNEDLIKDEDDMRELTILLAIFKEKISQIKFFNHNGITLECILEKASLPSDLFDGLDKEEIDQAEVDEYKGYIRGSSNAVSIQVILNRLLANRANNSQVIEKITKEVKGNYKYLIEEVSQNMYRELTPEEAYIKLQEETISKPDTTFNIWALYYGNDFLEYYGNVINSMLQKMSFTSKIAEALEQMKNLLKDSEESKEPTQNSIMSMFINFMGPDEAPAPTLKKYDCDKLVESGKVLEDYLKTLREELEKYTFIYQFIYIYVIKVGEIKSNLLEESELLKDKEYEDPTDKEMRKINIDSRLVTVNGVFNLLRQSTEIVKKAIINHNRAIFAIEIANKGLIPSILIQQNIFQEGKVSSEDGIMLITTLIKLMNNVVEGDDTGVIEKLAELAETNPDTYSLLSETAENYLQSIKEISEMNIDSYSGAYIKKRNRQPS